ncbi:hypothetical protein T261_4317 [Streptomyces lydicus]|nr:hypothetical protein T261_4317 [Streptomyces lydicus]
MKAHARTLARACGALAAHRECLRQTGRAHDRRRTRRVPAVGACLER